MISLLYDQTLPNGYKLTKPLGRDFPYPPDPAILRRRFRNMGSINHDSPWTVRLHPWPPLQRRLTLISLTNRRYLLSAIPLMTVHIPCTPPLLRGTNLIFSTLLIPAIISSVSALQRRRPFWRHFLIPSAKALVISTFPLIFFFGNLYYTEVASLAGVLGCYALALQGRYWVSSVVSPSALE